jgi:hypothetical protein
VCDETDDESVAELICVVIDGELEVSAIAEYDVLLL